MQFYNYKIKPTTAQGPLKLAVGQSSCLASLEGTTHGIYLEETSLHQAHTRGLLFPALNKSRMNGDN